ncbi:OLC1v1018252C1 [Oldenlandia corymbosa var. corymbosa]|uniref:OLC1v1018252C1 n=1 Tax=Oldenlandia corymbosa var. corymbosa TaxID=529605 RepID=A0AAV1EB63_OLDCO|nr:OLC1v1018252C1 [Oldenlandia corymbosa var. corymbosa]
MESLMDDWSALNPDLLVEIAKRIPDIDDFMAFRVFALRGESQPPWINLVLHGQEFQAKGKRRIEVRFGWLLTLTDSGDVTLLNPLSGRQFKLPNFRFFHRFRSNDPNPSCLFITKAVLLENPSEVSDFTLVAICGRKFLGFWRPGNKNWTRIKTEEKVFLDMTYHKGKLYAINGAGNIWSWDGNSPAGVKFADIVLSINYSLLPSYRQIYLVESSPSSSMEGKLLMILRLENRYDQKDRYNHDEPDRIFKKYFYTRHFRVYRLDTVKGDWTEISSLRGDTLFVGGNASICVSATEAKRSGIKPNSIYFTDDYLESFPTMGGGGRDMGIYDVENASVERFGGLDVGLDVEDKSVISFICPPFWVSPNN